MNNATNAATTTPTVTTVGKVTTYRNIKARDWTKFGHKHTGRVEVGSHACVTAGKSVTLWGSKARWNSGFTPYRKTFQVGDTAVHGSYNLVYTGTIVAIGAKTVTINDKGTMHRMSIYDFNAYNWDMSLNEIAERNYNWMLTG